MKNVLFAIVVMASFCIGFVYSNAITYSPKDLGTVNDMSIVESGIRRYFKSASRLPESLSELVALNYVEQCRCKDRWGGEIEYLKLSDTTIRLFSKGNPSLMSWRGVQSGISYVFSVDSEKDEIGDESQSDSTATEGDC